MMKRFLVIFSIITACFLMLVTTIRQSQAKHEALAKTYISQGLYDEALQSYHQATTHIFVLKSIIRLFGGFNAFLAILGILFILSGLILKKPLPSSQVHRIRITKNLNP